MKEHIWQRVTLRKNNVNTRFQPELDEAANNVII